jgi:hypothetical protein
VTRWFVRRVPAILLCIVSVLMSLVIIEQGRTIDSQRQLIRQLFHDSIELNAARLKLAQPKR